MVELIYAEYLCLSALFLSKGGLKMKYGYLLNAWINEGVPIPIVLDFGTHMHMLLTGSSGSGKSYALIYLLGMLIKNGIENIVFCDFKNSDDFRFLSGYSRYYTGDSTYDGIMSYYDDFVITRQSGNVNGYHLLILDEYPAFISYLATKDKLEKTKRAVEIQLAISEILMLGRGIGFGCWITTQRADASLFANGSRDNFMIVCALGRLSKEQRLMVFSGEDIPTDTIYQKGEGLLLADGKELMEVKFPMIIDLGDWNTHIRQTLLSSDENTEV